MQQPLGTRNTLRPRVDDDGERDAAEFVAGVEQELHSLTLQVANSSYLQGISEGTFQAAGVRFAHANAVHVAQSDVANVSVFVARAGKEEEILFFHQAALAAKARLDALVELAARLGIERDEIDRTTPRAASLVRTNYFARLAQYGSPAELALVLLLWTPIHAQALRRVAEGLERHYCRPASERAVPTADAPLDDSELEENDRRVAQRIIANSVEHVESTQALRRAAFWTLAYEGVSWEAYHACAFQGAEER